MDLNEIRQQIDTVDNEIVALLEERMKLVTRVSAYKQRTGKAIYDPEREQALLDKVGASVLNPEYKEAIVASFADIMKRSRIYQAGNKIPLRQKMQTHTSSAPSSLSPVHLTAGKADQGKTHKKSFRKTLPLL